MLQNSWRLDTSTSLLSRRIVRRLLAAALVVTLLSLLGYLLIVPFLHPRTHLVVLTMSDGRDAGQVAFEFARDDAEALQLLGQSIYLGGGAGGGTPKTLNSLASRAAMQRFGAELDQLNVRTSDVLMVYASTYAFADRGAAYVACGDFQPANPQSGRIAIRQWLQQLQGTAGGVKLLLLDAGRIADRELRHGLPDNCFPLLEQELREIGDPNLWLLISHSPLERSLAFDTLERSAFALCVERGLSGDADFNRDGAINLNELYVYVSTRVATLATVVSRGAWTQQVRLLNGGTRRAGQPLPTLAWTRTRRPPSSVASWASTRAQKPGRWSGFSSLSRQYSLSSASGRLTGRSTLASAATAASLRPPNPLLNPTLPTGAQMLPATASRFVDRVRAVTDPVVREARSSTPQPMPVSPDEKAGPVDAGKPAAATADPAASRPETQKPVNELPVAAAPVTKAPATEAPITEAPVKETNLPAGPAKEASAQERPAQEAAGDASSVQATVAGEPRSTAAVPIPEKPSTSPLAATLLMEGWRMRDLLASRSSGPSPADFAPHLWRRFQEELLHLESLYLKDKSVGEQSIVQHLRSSLLPLGTLLAGGVIPDGREMGIAQQIAREAVREPLDPDAVRSVGMVEAAARLGSRLPASEFLQRVAEFDRFGNDGSREALEKWVANPRHAGDLEALIEFWLAKRFVGEPDLDWPLVQLALRVARQGEQVAALDPQVVPWIRDTIHLADARRLAGERELFDRIDSEWRRRAEEWLLEALRSYQAAAVDGATVQAAILLRNDLLDRVPSMVRWYSAVGPQQPQHAPSYDTIERLVDGLLRLCSQIETANTAGMSELRMVQNELEELRSRVELDLQGLVESPPGEARWNNIRAVLETPLPDARQRYRLLESLREAESLLLSTPAATVLPSLENATVEWSTGPSDVARADVRERLQQWSRLEWKLMKLASVADSLNHVERTHELLQAELQEMVAGPLPDAALESFAQARTEFYRELPLRIASSLAENAAPRALRDQAPRRQALERAWRGAGMADARSAATIAISNPAIPLRRIQLFELLHLQQERAQRAREDVDFSEAVRLTDLAGVYRELAEKVPNQPPLPMEPPPFISIEGRREISLTEVMHRTLSYSVTNQSARTVPIWVVLQYDPTSVAVEVAPGPGVVYHDHLVRNRPGADVNASTPETTLLVRPDQLQLPATWELPSGQQQAIRLDVRRQTSAKGPTKLLVKTISGSTYVRHGLRIDLPVVDTLRLLVTGIPNSWSQQGNRLLLHPFPNRLTEYQLSLANPTSVTRVVDVTMLSPHRLRDVAPPPGALAADDAQRVLESVSPAVPLVALSKITIAGDGTPVAIPFPGPKAPGSDPSPPPAPDPKLPPAPALMHGLLLAITDAATQRTEFHQIEISPQRPWRFVRPTVSYDPEQERVEVRLSAEDKRAFPSEPIEVQAHFVDGLPPGTNAVLSGQLRDSDDELRLYATLPASPNRVARLQLAIDRYPRAFVFEIPCWQRNIEIPPSTELHEVRITQLPAGIVYKPPTGRIPVELQVDAPHGSFERAADQLRVGLDEDRDRELRDEPAIALQADRQVVVRLAQLAPAGRLTLDTKVDDFRVELPPARVATAKVDVLAELRVGGKVSWSRPAEILVDGAPPRLSSPQLKPGREVPPGTAELELSVAATDSGMSGVAKLEAAFDLSGSGKFGEEPKPMAAKPKLDGSWVVKLPTADLAPGVYSILIRGTDRVGNVSDYLAVDRIRILSAAEFAESKNKATPVTGRVLFGTEEVAGATVTLTLKDGPQPPAIQTSTAGAFTLPNVPAGKHKLSAAAVVRNKPRTAEIELDVPPPPGKVKPVELQLR